MLWFGIKWASKPADKEHPYGHGKAEALVAMGISLALTVAAGIIMKESIENISTPHKTPAAFTLAVLVIVIATKELLYRYVLKTGLEINSGAVKADAFHHRSDAITSAAAFIGITIGLIGGKGFEVADDWAALFAAFIILINAYKIFRPAMGELLDEDAPELNAQLKLVAEKVPGVLKIEKCHSRKMGVMNHADLHIWVKEDISVKEGHQIAHQVKANIQQEFPQFFDVMIHIEPYSTNS
jgi:cation diffusion facilitator family transporter